MMHLNDLISRNIAHFEKTENTLSMPKILTYLSQYKVDQIAIC